jgi:hypothetical protein
MLKQIGHTLDGGIWQRREDPQAPRRRLADTYPGIPRMSRAGT